MAQVFVSYVEEDGAIVEMIVAGIEAAGFTCWHFLRNSVPFVPHFAQTGPQISQCEVVLAVLSQRSLGSHHQMDEIEFARNERKEIGAIFVTPLTRDDLPPGLKMIVGARVAVTVDPSDFSKVAQIVARVVDGLRALGIKPTSPPKSPPPAPKPAGFSSLTADGEKIAARVVDALRALGIKPTSPPKSPPPAPKPAGPSTPPTPPPGGVPSFRFRVDVWLWIQREGEAPPLPYPCLVNERPPFYLPNSLEDAPSAYTKLAPFGVTADDDIEQIRNKVLPHLTAKSGDKVFVNICNEAVSELTDTRRRLILDIRLLPYRNFDLLSKAYNELCAVLFEHPDRMPDILGALNGLDPLDQVNLLAVKGESEKAAEQAWSGFLANPKDFDWVRASYLVNLHAAYHAREEPEKLEKFFSRAAAALGLLVTRTEALKRWIHGRMTVYGLSLDTMELDLGEVERALIATARDCLAALEGTPADRLNRILVAELKGARLLAERRVKSKSVQFEGGYLALQALNHISEYGQVIAKAYEYASTLSHFDLASWMGSTGWDGRTLFRLLVLYSPLRLADAEPGKPALLYLSGVPTSATSVSAQEYPCYHYLVAGTRVLNAHKALVAADCYLQMVRQQLAMGSPNRVDLVAALDSFAQMLTTARVEDNFAVTLRADLTAALSATSVAWAHGVLKKLDDLLRVSSDKFPEARQYFEDACALVELLLSRYRDGKLSEACGLLHLQFGIALANNVEDPDGAYAHVLRALDLLGDFRPAVINFLRAAGLRAAQLFAAGKRQEARDLIQQAIDKVRQHAISKEDGGVAAEIEDLERLFRETGSSPGLRSLEWIAEKVTE